MDFRRLIPLILLLVLWYPGVGETGRSRSPGAAVSGTSSAAHGGIARSDGAVVRRAARRENGTYGMAPAKGVFLVASETLNDPNFSQTVVLLLEYDDGGAVGLIINRPTEVSLASLLPEEEDLKHRRESVFIGGPVGRTQLFLLLRSSSRPRQSQRIVEEVYASTSLSALREILAEQSAMADFQAYAGYSGWGPGQLDRELMRGDWLIAPGDSETVFDKAADSIWPELIEKNRGTWVYRPSADLYFFATASGP
jgi:putative transcriptional regulator